MKLDLKLYRGYVNDGELVVFGHLFESWAPDKFSIEKRGIKHAHAILHKFRIKPLKNFKVRLKFNDLDVTTKTQEDGYFRFTIPYNAALEPGWHDYEISCKMYEVGMIEKGELLKPYPGKLGIISDIDDTFLISHSNTFFKKLYVMLSKNINKRKVYDDVVKHYSRLSQAGQDSKEATNSFFFVSSSEWNLYDFIDEFANLHGLPKAVIKLKKIKTGLRDFVSSGRGNHDHKFIKIKDIISFYPHLKYVLMGDDSQHDPYLYERICKVFPMNIKAVYIRQTTSKQNKKVQRVLANIETMNVSTCYFRDSEKAIHHSEREKII
ncbi:App1 family protein [Christiangramia echinicola]|uniref:App1 family protein n=1 Tax=Christiangramia echinicola TaxID=279359 RepID=UPI00041617B2|nr:App1 family protein [Christiangramia echinicola]